MRAQPVPPAAASGRAPGRPGGRQPGPAARPHPLPAPLSLAPTKIETPARDHEQTVRPRPSKAAKTPKTPPTREHGDVLQVGLAVLAKARRLDRHHLGGR
jgi:hypothetical protein